MGIKRRAMNNPKFKNSRPERWALGEKLRAKKLTKLQQKLADTVQLKSENTEELTKVEETRTENVPQINKIVTDVTEESKVELKAETETIVTEAPKPKAKRTTRKKTTAKAKTTTQAKATTKTKTTRRRRTKKTAS